MDYYFSKETQLARMASDYKKHGNILVATDMDDTCWNFFQVEGRTYLLVLELLKDITDLGWPIMLFTAAKPEKFDEMIEHLNERGIKITSINQNVFPMEYGNWGKPYYNWLLDDKSGLHEAYTLLREFVNIIKNEKSI